LRWLLQADVCSDVLGEAASLRCGMVLGLTSGFLNLLYKKTKYLNIVIDY
jgi:hypothetical protein